MTRLVALFFVTVGIGALVACGGGDKEPLTPDNVESAPPAAPEAPAATDVDAAAPSESAPSN